MISLPSLLAQLAGVEPSSTLIRSLIDAGAGALLLGMQGATLRSSRKARDEMRATRQYLFGINGDNGMHSQVQAVERRLERHDEQLATHDKRLTVLEYGKDHHNPESRG